jgi:hypothetical protein
MDCYKPTAFVLEVRPRNEPRNAAPVAWLLVERHIDFRHDAQGRLLDASVCVSCQPITARYSRDEQSKSHFHGSYNSVSNGMVSLTSNSLTSGGYVVLENTALQSHRIGTFLMNEVVQWVQRWPDATVRTVSLSSGDAHGDNKERRNRFYEQLGLEFDYDDSEHMQGCSRPMLAKQLKRVETWKENITVHSMPDYLANVLHEKERDSLELMQRNRAVKDLINEQRAAEAKPIRCTPAIKLKSLVAYCLQC